MRKSVRVPVAAEQFDDPSAVYNERTRRARTARAVSVQRGPIVANRPGAPAARAAFAACVEAVVDALGDPLILTFGGYVGVCWMTVPGGLDAPEWRYRIVGAHGVYGGSLGGLASTDDAERACRKHLTQYATDYQDDASVMAAWAFLLPDQRDDHLRYAAWQRARRAADAVDCADRHRWAGEHQGEHLPALLALAADAAAGERRPPHDDTSEVR